MSTSEEAAVNAARKLLVEAAEAEEATPSGEDEGEQEAEAPETFEFPSFQVTLPEELDEDLSVEDDSTPVEEEEDEYNEYESEAEKELRRKLKQVEKERDHYRAIREKNDRKQWEKEASEYFTLATPLFGEIQATSKRAFMRQAKAIHEKLDPMVQEKVIKPAQAALEAEREKIRAEERERAAKAWGRPVPASGGADEVDAQETQRQIETARAKGDLSGAIKAMLQLKE